MKDFDPLFYCGGAFSSFSAGENARSWYQLLGVMRAQRIIEEARFIRRRGSSEGHIARLLP